MAYEKQNFEDGKILSASQLNHIEDGIETVERAIGKAAPLIVTYDGETTSELPSAIHAYVSYGGPVYLEVADLEYIPLSFCNETHAQFLDIRDGQNHIYEIDPYGNLTSSTLNFATKDEIGDISTALDGIVAIQNELIGGDGT